MTAPPRKNAKPEVERRVVHGQAPEYDDGERWDHDSQLNDDEDQASSGPSYSPSQSVTDNTYLASVLKVSAVEKDSNVVDATTQAINNHIAKIMGIKVPEKSQSDPDWVPPPWFDLRAVRV